MFAGKNKLKVLLVIVFIVVLAVAAFFIYFMTNVNSYQEKVRSTIISDIDISGIPDGSYIGEYDAGLVYANVEVHIESGKIADILIIEHRNGRGMSAESIVDTIISQQKIDVDAISGATSSSTVIKKAIELALLRE